MPDLTRVDYSNPPPQPAVFKETETFWYKHKVKILIGALVGVALLVSGAAIPVFATAAAFGVFALFQAAVIGTTAGVVGAVIAGLGAVVSFLTLLALARAFFEHPPGMFDRFETPYEESEADAVNDVEFFNVHLGRYHPQDRPYVSYSSFKDGTGVVNIVEREEIKDGEFKYRIVARCTLKTSYRVADGKLAVQPENPQWLDSPIAVNEKCEMIDPPLLDHEENSEGINTHRLDSPLRMYYDPNSGEDLHDKALRFFGERLKKFHPVNEPSVSYGYRSLNDYGLGVIFERRGGNTRDVAEFGLKTALDIVSGMVTVTPTIHWTQPGYEHYIIHR